MRIKLQELMKFALYRKFKMLLFVSRIMRLKKEYGKTIHGRADVIIGKNFITENIIEEILRQFEEKYAVKVKFLDLPLELDIKEAAQTLADRTKSKVIDTRGRTCVLYLKS